MATSSKKSDMPQIETFKAKIKIIGVNPYVLIPVKILKNIFQQAGKNKGPIPVRGKLNGKNYIQTLVKYSGKWRLYLNMPMRKAGKCDVGDFATFSITFDPKLRTTHIPVQLKTALSKNKDAKAAFEKLPLHYQKEIKRYINSLKTEESVNRAVERAIQHLLGKVRFVGRDAPTSKH
jgi:hypothetical protein